MSKKINNIKINLPCLYHENFEEKASYSIKKFLNENFTKDEEIEEIVDKTHTMSRRYFDSSLIRDVVINWTRD